jgi:hypothetical protein
MFLHYQLAIKLLEKAHKRMHRVGGQFRHVNRAYVALEKKCPTVTFHLQTVITVEGKGKFFDKMMLGFCFCLI